MYRGAKKIIVGIGGSATIDGGAGMAQALGVRFINSKGKEIRSQASGGMLHRIKDIDMANLHPGVINCEIIIASDVDSISNGKALEWLVRVSNVTG